ncbi:hypothetical protein PLACP1_14750 [Planifilum fimeticola]
MQCGPVSRARMQVEQGDPADQARAVTAGQQPDIFAGYRCKQDMGAGGILRVSDSTPLPCPEAE